MSVSTVRRLAVEVFGLGGAVSVRWFLSAARPLRLSERRFCEGLKDTENSFDLSLMKFLVCPLSKKPLRYDKATNELINEELGIAYPIIDGIPNMIPKDARLIKKTEAAEPTQS
ncbi:UPF0434 protein BRADO0313-like [Hoplias malabaricus]|uniref:UPF0434 protein BRADO0313-like n=1 Tax=Hoplias malabaricus TaxID=27720 RepID=UPI0034636010